VKADQEQPTLAPRKCIQRRLKEVLGHVVVEGPLVAAHLVLVQSAVSLRERALQKLLGLAAQRPLEHEAKATMQLMLLTGNERPVIVGTEDLPEGRVQRVVDFRHRRADPECGEHEVQRGRARPHADRVPHAAELGVGGLEVLDFLAADEAGVLDDLAHGGVDRGLVPAVVGLEVNQGDAVHTDSLGLAG